MRQGRRDEVLIGPLMSSPERADLLEPGLGTGAGSGLSVVGADDSDRFTAVGSGHADTDFLDAGRKCPDVQCPAGLADLAAGEPGYAVACDRSVFAGKPLREQDGAFVLAEEKFRGLLGDLEVPRAGVGGAVAVGGDDFN